ISKYKNATLLKPNRKELSELTGMPVATLEEAEAAAVFLCREASCKYVLATLGADGMLLVDTDGLIAKVQSAAKEVYDVTGAGDTSIAYLAAEYLMGKKIDEAMRIANIAAGIQVSKVGTSIVTPEEVASAMDGNSDKKVVFTNGCFDILHAGHIDYLKKARALGDRLIVGLNSDASVKRLKGDQRPINTLMDRKLVLEALSFVDEVIPFEEDTPLELIKKVRPDVLVKGGDYDPDEIVGAAEVRSWGGTVMTLPFVEGKSTTAIIEKLEK
ncbi:MAG: D-glycero-beta-D-manno-heptose 1-phosphate adenylyltransferase, partial [Lachnospiraceae bacterium]|nr:D-glycero-beta-D-manno-heptose 1-phosphate adenylyltransferase [Lachnospiraceae bacterium]